LFRLDASLGIQAASIARPLQGSLHIPLWIIYQSMVPMMIAWYLLTRNRRSSGSIILAYVAELVSGPLLYTIVPACGPIYAFGKQWLHPPAVTPDAVRLAGMPNAFPSLHIGTALVFLMFAPGKIWKAVAFLFLAATSLATLSTGEHYVIDLIAGLAFGVFVSAIGMRNYHRASYFLALTLTWSLGVRFAYMILLAHPILTRSLAALTVLSAAIALGKQWSTPPALNTTVGVQDFGGGRDLQAPENFGGSRRLQARENLGGSRGLQAPETGPKETAFRPGPLFRGQIQLWY
jgi:hypothetical protein